MSARKTTSKALWSYVIGFAFSIFLTLDAYYLVTRHYLATNGLVLAIMALAVAQLAVQLIFFLHLGDEPKPRWRFLVFLFMLMVLLIVVIGSLWIMNHLNYNMTPQQMQNYLKDQGSF